VRRCCPCRRSAPVRRRTINNVVVLAERTLRIGGVGRCRGRGRGRPDRRCRSTADRATDPASPPSPLGDSMSQRAIADVPRAIRCPMGDRRCPTGDLMSQGRSSIEALLLQPPTRKPNRTVRRPDRDPAKLCPQTASRVQDGRHDRWSTESGAHSPARSYLRRSSPDAPAAVAPRLRRGRRRRHRPLRRWTRPRPRCRPPRPPPPHRLRRLRLRPPHRRPRRPRTQRPGRSGRMPTASSRSGCPPGRSR
jgi:hypothetical protein